MNRLLAFIIPIVTLAVTAGVTYRSVESGIDANATAIGSNATQIQRISAEVKDIDRTLIGLRIDVARIRTILEQEYAQQPDG